MSINFRAKKCSGQSQYGRYGSYTTDEELSTPVVKRTCVRGENSESLVSGLESQSFRAWDDIQ